MPDGTARQPVALQGRRVVRLDESRNVVSCGHGTVGLLHQPLELVSSQPDERSLLDAIHLLGDTLRGDLHAPDALSRGFGTDDGR
jgi:hypothetical protein